MLSKNANTKSTCKRQTRPQPLKLHPPPPTDLSKRNNFQRTKVKAPTNSVTINPLDTFIFSAPEAWTIDELGFAVLVAVAGGGATVDEAGTLVAGVDEGLGGWTVAGMDEGWIDDGTMDGWIEEGPIDGWMEEAPEVEFPEEELFEEGALRWTMRALTGVIREWAVKKSTITLVASNVAARLPRPVLSVFSLVL